MNNQELDEFLQDLDFDVAEPPHGHHDRFAKKLRDKKITAAPQGGKIRSLWSPLLAVAAGLLLIFYIGGGSLEAGLITSSGDMAGLSPEIKETHQFYTTLIKTELAKVKAENSPETQVIVKDALTQMEKLDLDYERLKEDLKKSGEDKRVISAMITNLQQRIDLLNNVLDQIEKIKELKNSSNENNFI